jgi:hypothetical protein
MSTPDDGPRTAPDAGRYPEERPGHGQPAYGQPGYGPPGYGPPGYGPPHDDPPPFDPVQYGNPEYGQTQYAQSHYGQQPYAQPPWGPPGYGTTPYPPPGFAYGRPTNTLAIVSLVLAFVFAPAGLITGIIARRQIKQTHEDGDGLALAGLIVGGIGTAVFVLIIVFWIIAFAALNQNVVS